MKDRHVAGELLRDRRIRAQRSVKDIALAARVSVWHLSDIEHGRAYCSDMLLHRLAQVYNCEPADFTRPGQHPNHANFRHRYRKPRRKAAA